MKERKKNWKVLFIDDSHTEIRYLKLFFQINELQVDPVFINSAHQALEELGNMDMHEFPDAIIVDINMPLMDGFEFAKAFVEMHALKNPEMNLFIYSTSINSSDIRMAEAIEGVRGFIPKPFTENIFESKVLPWLTQSLPVEP